MNKKEATITSEKIQLLFEGHLAEAIVPQLFKILEPFPLDVDEWARQNSSSGYPVYSLNGLLVMFATGPSGKRYVLQNKTKLNVDWDDAGITLNPAPIIGGLML